MILQPMAMVSVRRNQLEASRSHQPEQIIESPWGRTSKLNFSAVMYVLREQYLTLVLSRSKVGWSHPPTLLWNGILFM